MQVAINLEATRKILLMSAAEAARLLAATPHSPNGVSETTWNRWEKGVKPLPLDVYEQIESILQRRREYLLPLLQQLQQRPLIIDWHIEQSADTMDWYIKRSAHAELLALGAKQRI